jgi:hypothetical protein
VRPSKPSRIQTRSGTATGPQQALLFGTAGVRPGSRQFTTTERSSEEDAPSRETLPTGQTRRLG